MFADLMGRHKGIKCSCWHTSWRKSNLYWHKVWKRGKRMTIIHTLIKSIENLHLNLISKKEVELLLCDHWVIVKFKGFCPLWRAKRSQVPYFWRLVKACSGGDFICNLPWASMWYHLIEFYFSLLLAYSKIYLFWEKQCLITCTKV